MCTVFLGFVPHKQFLLDIVVIAINIIINIINKILRRGRQNSCPEESGIFMIVKSPTYWCKTVASVMIVSVVSYRHDNIGVLITIVCAWDNRLENAQTIIVANDNRHM